MNLGSYVRKTTNFTAKPNILERMETLFESPYIFEVYEHTEKLFSVTNSRTEFLVKSSENVFKLTGCHLKQRDFLLT